MLLSKLFQLIDIVQMDTLLLGKFPQQLRLGGSGKLIQWLESVDANDDFQVWALGLQADKHWQMAHRADNKVELGIVDNKFSGIRTERVVEGDRVQTLGHGSQVWKSTLIFELRYAFSAGPYR